MEEEDKSDNFTKVNEEPEEFQELKLGKRESIAPSNNLKTISETDHYKDMVRTFDMSRWWIWVINGIVTIACFIAYLLIDGKEIVFAQFIPLDIFLNIMKTAFYFFYYYRDKMDKENEKRIKERIKKIQAKLAMNDVGGHNDLKIPLL